MIKFEHGEPYRIQFMGDDCFLVCFGVHTGAYFKEKTGRELTENNNSFDFEIMVKRQDSISAVVAEAKKKLKELLPLISTE